MAYDPIVDTLARMIARADNGPGRAPRLNPTTTLIGNIAAADPYQRTVSFEKGGLVVPGIRFIQAYTEDRLPREGDVGVLSVTGAGVFLLGRHVEIGQTPLVSSLA